MTRSGGAVTWGMARLSDPVSDHFRWWCSWQSPSSAPLVEVHRRPQAAARRRTSVRSTTTSTNAQASGVLAAYRAEQAAFEEALQQADPTFPALAQTMTGTSSTRYVEHSWPIRRTGSSDEGTVQLNPKVASVQGNPGGGARLPIQLDRTRVLRHRQTCTPSNSAGARRRASHPDQASSGIWKVSDQNVIDGTCPAGY